VRYRFGRISGTLNQSDGDTRRQAATDFTQALLVQFEQQITSITNGYISSYLQVSAQSRIG